MKRRTSTPSTNASSRAAGSVRRGHHTITAIALAIGTVIGSAGLVSSSVSASPETGADAERLGHDFVVTDDGTYIWYNDERAVIRDRALLAGFVQVDGGAGITAVDLATGRRLSQNIVLKQWTNGDDHNNPSIVPMANGGVGTFYTAHAAEAVQYSRFSSVPVPTSIDDFGSEQKFRTTMNGVDSKATYNNAYQLSAEDGKIFNFMRLGHYTFLEIYDSNGKPLLAAPKQLLWDPGPGGTWYGRPYVKYASNGVDRIDMFLTNAHASANAMKMFHAYYQGGNLYESDGTLIGNVLADGPFKLEQTTLVYDSAAKINGGIIPWNHEIKVGPDGNPVIVYSRQRTTYELEYQYAVYQPDDEGGKWIHTKVAEAGTPLIPEVAYDPITGEKMGNPQRDYAGGIAINPDNVNEVFISANISPITNLKTPKYEIYRGEFANGSFTWTAITQDSRDNNYRPFVPIGAQHEDQVVIWFAGKYINFTNETVGTGPQAHYYVGYDTKIVGRYLHRGFEQASDQYAIDLNGEHAITAQGYTPLDAAGRSPLVTERATIKMVNPNGGRERPDVDGEILSDFGFAWRDLDVAISNLSAGYYRFSLTSYDLLNDQNVAVQFFPSGADPVTVVESHSQTDPFPASFVAKVDGDTEYTLRLHRLGTRASVLNSLQITPWFEPVASFQPTSDVEAAVGTTVSFDGSSSLDPDGGPLSYEWRSTGMPGVAARGATFERSFPAPGRYGVELTVIDGDGQRSRQHINVNVSTSLPSTPPVASFEPSSTIEVTVGTKMVFDGSASVDPDGGPLTYEWRSTRLSGVASGTATFERTFDTPGRFGVELTVIDDEGQRARQHINVRVVPAPPDVTVVAPSTTASAVVASTVVAPSTIP